MFQHRPPHHYAPRQRRWRKAEKDPSYGNGPAFFVKYRIVPLEWWSNGTTLENLHAHVHLKGKLAPFAFHCRCTSAHGANRSFPCLRVPIAPNCTLCTCTPKMCTLRYTNSRHKAARAGLDGGSHCGFGGRPRAGEAD